MAVSLWKEVIPAIEIFLSKARSIPKIRFLKQPSTSASLEVDDESADLIHIDAAHDYANVSADISAWWPKLRRGGVMLLHDTRSFPNDVGRAFSEFPAKKAEILEHHGLGALFKD